MKIVKKSAVIIFILYLFFTICAEEALALGGYLTGDYGQVAPIEVKAIIDYDGTIETITATQTFAFNPLVVTNFYWVMAYPTKVEIKKPQTKEDILKDVFLELEKKTQKKFSKDNIFRKLLYPDIVEEKSEPAQTFSRTAWIKYLKPVPDFKNMAELETWFRANAYPIPKNSRELFSGYLKKRWHFILADVDGSHLEISAPESLTINGAHTIPIQFKFRTDKIIYPLELIKIQPDRDSVNTPLSFEYGSSSQDVLGVRDEKVSDLLSTPSSNLHPPLLLDLMNIKIDLFVKAKYKVEAEGFTTVFSDKVNGKYLTRIVAYWPMTQIEDVTIVRAKAH